MGRHRTSIGAALRTVQEDAPRRPLARLVGVVHPSSSRPPRQGNLPRPARRFVAYARSQRAPAIEGYPVDNEGKKVDLTMAYVGTRALFERAGFTKAADTDAVSGGFPRLVMRLDLH